MANICGNNLLLLLLSFLWLFFCSITNNLSHLLFLQDELSSTAFGGEEEQQGTDSAERRKSSHRAVLEKKLSIAERAVATNPSCIALQLERLKICQELWEPSALAKEWKKLVSPHVFLFISLRCLSSLHAVGACIPILVANFY